MGIPQHLTTVSLDRKKYLNCNQTPPGCVYASTFTTMYGTFTMTNLKQVSFTLLALMLLAGLAMSVVPQVAKATAPDKIAILMYADWCGSCKILDPKLKAVQPEFEGKNILFVRFDLTNDATKHQSGLLAQALGVSELYEKNAGKTGYLTIVDRASGQSIERITKDHSEADIRASLSKASGSRQ
ncbi:MAG: thioredoxin domain-containing protein [Thiotrichales bacterium]